MNNRHNKLINNIVEEYSKCNYTLEEFCFNTKRNKNVVKKYMNEYLEKIYTVEAEDFIENSYFIYDIEKNTEDDVINKKVMAKIIGKECFIYSPKIIDKNNIQKEELVILKFKYVNLKFFSENKINFINNICIIDENFKIIYPLADNILEDFEYEKDICFETYYDYYRRYLPKIENNVTLLFPLPTHAKKIYIAFKDVDIEGYNLKKISIETMKIKDISNKVQCPNCTSLNTIKDGKRNGKQRYKCNCCKRRFTEGN